MAEKVEVIKEDLADLTWMKKDATDKGDAQRELELESEIERLMGMLK